MRHTHENEDMLSMLGVLHHWKWNYEVLNAENPGTKPFLMVRKPQSTSILNKSLIYALASFFDTALRGLIGDCSSVAGRGTHLMTSLRAMLVFSSSPAKM